MSIAGLAIFIIKKFSQTCWLSQLEFGGSYPINIIPVNVMYQTGFGKWSLSFTTVDICIFFYVFFCDYLPVHYAVMAYETKEGDSNFSLTSLFLIITLEKFEKPC